jgi:hypothetical protein
MAVGQDLAGGEGQRWLGNTSHGEARMDRRLRLAKKRGRPLARNPQLGGGGELGAARRGQRKVGSAAGVAKAGKAMRKRVREHACAPGRFGAHNSERKLPRRRRLSSRRVQRRRARPGTERQTKGPSLPCVVNTCACVGARARGCARRPVRAHADVKTAAAVTGRPGRRKRGKQYKGGERAARGGDGNDTCKRNIPACYEGRNHTVQARRRNGGDKVRAFLPSARWPGLNRGEGKQVLTSVATGQSAGVGEEGRSVLVGVEEDDGAVQRK